MKSFIKAWWPLFIIIIIAIFFRFYNLAATPPGLYPDEAMDGTNAQEAIATGNYKIFYPENNGREGLFMNIQSVFLRVFNANEPWVLRSVSAIFGTLTVLGIYLLVLEILKGNAQSKLIAFASSLFVALSFWHINFSRISFRAIMAPAFMVWGLYFLVKTLNKLRDNSQGKLLYWTLTIIGGLVYGLGMHSYIAYRATPLLVILAYLIYWLIYKIKFKKVFLNFVVFVVFALIAFAPLGIYFAKNPADFMGRTSQLSVTASSQPLKDLAINTIKTLGMFNVAGDYNWRHNYSGSPELYWPVGILFIVGIILGIAQLFRKNSLKEIRFLSWISLLWMAIAALPVVISNEGLPHALRSILMIPPAYILAGIGLYFVYQFLENKINKKILTAFGILIVLGLIAQSYISYFILWANNPNVAGAFTVKYADIGRQINQISGDIPKYVVVNAGGVDVRGIPMPAQTIMFLTDSFTPEKQKEKNIHYVLPDQENTIPINSLVFYMEPR